MSLIVACNCCGCQYWCGDRILRKWSEGISTVVSRNYRKIRQFPGIPVVVGLSGSAYDADLLWTTLSALKGLSSKEDLLEIVRTAVKQINQCSAEFAIANRLNIHETGILIGGYWGDDRFLSVIDPNGRLLEMSAFGAIGYGSGCVAGAIAGKLAPSADWKEAAFLVDRCHESSPDDLASGGQALDRILVRPCGVQEVTQQMASKAIDRHE